MLSHQIALNKVFICRYGGTAPVVEHGLSKCETLSSTPFHPHPPKKTIEMRSNDLLLACFKLFQTYKRIRV